jgi:hypothetical protein
VYPELETENEFWVRGFGEVLRFGNTKVNGAAEAAPATTAFTKTIPIVALVRDFRAIMGGVGISLMKSYYPSLDPRPCQQLRLGAFCA